jgi:hypothetical protein
MLSAKKYQDFCRCMLTIIARYFPQCDAKIAQELLALCAKRNYIMRCLAGRYKTSDSIKLSPKTIRVLETVGFLPKQKDRRGVGLIRLKINECDAKFINRYLKKEKRNQLNIQKISMLVETVSKFHLKPAY